MWQKYSTYTVLKCTYMHHNSKNKYVYRLLQLLLPSQMHVTQIGVAPVMD